MSIEVRSEIPISIYNLNDNVSITRIILPWRCDQAKTLGVNITGESQGADKAQLVIGLVDDVAEDESAILVLVSCSSTLFVRVRHSIVQRSSSRDSVSYCGESEHAKKASHGWTMSRSREIVRKCRARATSTNVRVECSKSALK
jgi:hypothetical protein